MTTKQYMDATERLTVQEVSKLVDELSHVQRIELREALGALGYAKLLRSLWFDYATQQWIE